MFVNAQWPLGAEGTGAVVSKTLLNRQESIAIATEFKHSMWRIRPPPRIVGEVSEFDNRSDKKNNRKSNQNLSQR